jgi:2-methylisocitrate lyase-like PEP mutase family enzyme
MFNPNDTPEDTAVLKAKAERLLELHEPGDPLVLANIADVIGARIVAQAGMPAVATSSAGIAWALGYADGEHIARQEMIGMAGRIAASVPVPVTADLEAGYGTNPEDVAATIRAALGAGIVGFNIEDGQHSDPPLRSIEDAVARLRAAREAADAMGIPMVINARTDPYLRGLARDGREKEVFADTVTRAEAYMEAGADCIFIPGVIEAATIGALAKEIAAPINILANASSPPVQQLADLGVARISVGGLLQRATATLMREAVQELTTTGTYSFGKDTFTNPQLNRIFVD